MRATRRWRTTSHLPPPDGKRPRWLASPILRRALLAGPLLAVWLLSYPGAASVLDGLALTGILTMVIVATAFISYWLLKDARQEVDVSKQTEAMVLIGVIIAVILLGVTGKIGSDGLISVLAAIVAWTAARTTDHVAHQRAASRPQSTPADAADERAQPE